jgi:hypothetical protein
MRGRILIHLAVTVIMLASCSVVCEAQKRPDTGGNSNHNSFFSKIFKKKPKPYESRDVTKARREQEKKEAKLKKEYEKYVADSRKRAYDIQSPDVQARMMQNEKDIKAREKARRKKNSKATMRGANKYK